MLRIATALLLMTGMAAPAAAQHVCASRDALMQSLADDFKEAPAALGISDGGNVVELLTSGEGGTWTILMTTPDGTSCVIATGQQWEPLPQQVALGEPA